MDADGQRAHLGVLTLRLIVYTSLVIVSALVLSSPVLAGDEDFESDIEWGRYRSVRIPFDEGNVIDIQYRIEVLDGPPVDVIFTNERGFKEYKDPDSPSFFFFPHQSSMNTTNASMFFTWVDPGTYFLIVDNSAIANEVIIAEANVTVKGSVSWNTHDTWIDLCIWILVVVIIVAVVSTLIIIVRNRRKRAEVKDKAREDPEFLRDLVTLQRSDKLDGEQRVAFRRVQNLAEDDPQLKAEIDRLKHELDEQGSSDPPQR